MVMAGRILITGSTRGIGRATAEILAAQGAEVILHGRRREDVDAAVARLAFASAPVSGVAADLASRAEVARLAETAGEVDVLINCAGIYEEQAAENLDAQSWARTMDVNLTAPWLLSRLLLDGLKHRHGLIINVASDAGFLGIAGGGTYCASKGGLIGLTKALAVELAPDVRALCICPGPVDTDMMKQTVAAAQDQEAAHVQWTNYALLKRTADAREIASLIAYAASKDAAFATGSVWLMDGGLTAGKRLYQKPGL